MGEALRTIAFKVRTASCGGTACVNSFGDEQLAVDMVANQLLFEVRLHFVIYSWMFFSCSYVCILGKENHRKFIKAFLIFMNFCYFPWLFFRLKQSLKEEWSQERILESFGMIIL